MIQMAAARVHNFLAADRRAPTEKPNSKARLKREAEEDWERKA